MLSKEHRIYNTTFEIKKKKQLFHKKRESARYSNTNTDGKNEEECSNHKPQNTLPLFSINIKDFSTTLDALLENFSMV